MMCASVNLVHASGCGTGVHGSTDIWHTDTNNGHVSVRDKKMTNYNCQTGNGNMRCDVARSAAARWHRNNSQFGLVQIVRSRLSCH